MEEQLENNTTEFNGPTEFAEFIVSEEGAVLSELKEELPVSVNFATLHSAMSAKRPCGCGGLSPEKAIEKRSDRFNYLYKKFLNDLTQEQKSLLKNIINKYKNSDDVIFRLGEEIIVKL